MVRFKDYCSDILEREIVLFGGKGGTGKTVCAAAAGLYAAEHGKKTLVFSTDPAHSLADIFCQSIGDEVTPIKGEDNLYGYEIDAKRVLDEERSWWIPNVEKLLRDMSKRGLEREILQKTWDMPLAGVDELMALSKLIDFIEMKEFDAIIVDTAAGAHTLSMIGLPNH